MIAVPPSAGVRAAKSARPPTDEATRPGPDIGQERDQGNWLRPQLLPEAARVNRHRHRQRKDMGRLPERGVAHVSDCPRHAADR